MRIGIIDVGTNSIHLLIGEIDRDRSFRVVRKARELTRLGDEGLVSGALTPRAMRRGIAVLRRYATLLKRHRTGQIEAVATSAVREAKNGPAFVRRVRARLGLPLRIISGREEARLIYLGLRQGARFHQGALILWIGGGSAQVIVGDEERPRYLTSLPLGAARLTQRFIRHDPPRAEEIEALCRHTRRAWAPAIRAIRRRRWQQSLGGSVMMRELMLAAYSLQRRRPPIEERRLSISRRTLQRLVAWLSTSTAAERKLLAGVDPRREDLLLATGIVLLTWMDGCGISRLRFAPGSLREGLVADCLEFIPTPPSHYR